VTFFFGDSSPVTFEGNFLEVLRDATAFAAEIAKANETIVSVDARKAEHGAEAEADARRLEALMRAVLATVAAADKGKVTSSTARFAAEIAGVSTERQKAAGEAIRAKLAEELRATADAVASARERYAVALETYLRIGDPPGGEREIMLALVYDENTDEEHYSADVMGRSAIGLTWSLELSIPAGSPWAAALRVDTLGAALALNAPQKTGIIKKEVKRKRQKIHRWVVARALDDGPRIHFSLRPELGEETGFDFTADCAARTLVAARVGAKDDPSTGRFPVDAEDLGPLLAFAAKVQEAVRALPRKRLVSAQFDGLPFDGTDPVAQPRLIQIVPRLVQALAPTVHQIAARSLADDELILRRSYPDGQREEIFMPKGMLRDKIAPLDEAHRAMFSMLGLEPRKASVRPPAMEPSIDVAMEPAVEVQSTLHAKAAPLPPMRPMVRSQVPAATIPPPPPPDVRNASRGASPNVTHIPAPPPAKMRPPVRTEPLMLTTRAKKRPSTAPPRNTELVTTLKEIRSMAKDGRVAESFRQLSVLYNTAAFAACRADDRRRALRMLVFGKPHVAAAEDRLKAHQAAVAALQLLVVEHHEPSDYEMLGMAYAALGEPMKATEIWKKALDIERGRDPGSELCGNLMRRVSAL
jgi:hypothetical protein